MKKPKVRMNKQHWQLGFDAGRSGQPDLPPESVEVLSWHSGYIEGLGERTPTKDK